MDTTAAETFALLSLLIRALVDDRESVQITPVSEPINRTVFQVRVAGTDVAKVIGRGGRTVRSIRQLLSSIPSENGGSFGLVLNSA